MEHAVSWSDLIWVLMALAALYALEMWLLLRRHRRSQLDSLHLDTLQKQMTALQKDMRALAQRIERLERRPMREEVLRPVADISPIPDPVINPPAPAPAPVPSPTESIPETPPPHIPPPPQPISPPPRTKVVDPSVPDPNSTPYRRAIELARSGVAAAEVAQACGISRSEAELIVALYRRTPS